MFFRKEGIMKIIEEQKRITAITYLAKNPGEAPELTHNVLLKLEKTSESAMKIAETMREIEETHTKLESQLKEMGGKMKAFVEVVADFLTPDQIDEYSDKFEQWTKSEREKLSTTSSAQQQKKERQPDMAGSTINASAPINNG